MGRRREWGIGEKGKGVEKKTGWRKNARGSILWLPYIDTLHTVNPPVIESILGQNDQFLVTGGVCVFVHECVAFLSSPPPPPQLRHSLPRNYPHSARQPPPAQTPPPSNHPAEPNPCYWGSAEKGPNPCYWRGLLLGGVYGSKGR